MLNKKIIIKKINKNKNFIKKKFGVKNLFLFGSYAKGEETKNSDIDFLVEFVKDDFLNELDFQTYLYGLFECKVEVLDKKHIRKNYEEDILYKSYKEEVFT